MAWIRYLAAILFTMSVAHAAEKQLGFAGEAGLGLVAARGNTDTETLNLSLSGRYVSAQWHHKIAVKVLTASEGNRDTADRVELSAQSDYEVSERSYAFGSFRYQDDEFSQFDAQSSVALGYGRKVLDSAAHELAAELGVGVRRSEFRGNGSSDSVAIVRGQLNYRWNLSEHATLTNELLVEAGSDNTFVRNLTALSTEIAGDFGLQFGHEIRHNSDVREPSNNSDFLTTVHLIYHF